MCNLPSAQKAWKSDTDNSKDNSSSLLYVMYLSKPWVSISNMIKKAQKQNMPKECKQKCHKKKRKEKRSQYVHAQMTHIQR